jgi:hypothetical protein
VLGTTDDRTQCDRQDIDQLMVTGPVDPWINDYAKMGLNPPVLVHLAIKARSPRFYVMRWPWKPCNAQLPISPRLATV